MRKEKWESRDRKQKKARHGMRVDGKSARLLQEILIRKSEEAKK